MRFKLVNKVNNKGFSIFEVIVAVYIIAMGMIGVLSLIMQSIQAQSLNKNMVMASQLAQEGLELVRNIRDTNWLNGDDWKFGGGPPNENIVQAGNNNTYTIDYTGDIDGNVDDIDENGARLNIRSGGPMVDFYSHNSGVGDLTPFYRLIRVQENPVDGSLDVECKVRWQVGGQNRDYVVATVLYDWR